MSLVNYISDKYPGVEGINTLGDVITSWPTGIGPKPTSAQIEAWAAEIAILEEDIIAMRLILNARKSAFGLEGETELMHQLLIDALLDAHYGDSTSLDNVREKLAIVKANSR